MNADTIIANAALESQQYHDPLERLAREVGMLRSEIRKLLPDPLPAPKGSYRCQAEIDGLGDCTICYDYSPGRPGVHTLRNGDPGYPDEPAELYVTAVQIGGCEFDCEVFSEEVKDNLTAAAEADCIKWCEEQQCEDYVPDDYDLFSEELDRAADGAGADYEAGRTA